MVEDRDNIIILQRRRTQIVGNPRARHPGGVPYRCLHTSLLILGRITLRNGGLVDPHNTKRPTTPERLQYR